MTVHVTLSINDLPSNFTDTPRTTKAIRANTAILILSLFNHSTPYLTIYKSRPKACNITQPETVKFHIVKNRFGIKNWLNHVLWSANLTN